MVFDVNNYLEQNSTRRVTDYKCVNYVLMKCKSITHKPKTIEKEDLNLKAPARDRSRGVEKLFCTASFSSASVLDQHLLDPRFFCATSLEYTLDNHDTSQISFQIGRLFFMLSEATPPEMNVLHWAALLAIPGRIHARPMLLNVGASYPGSPMMACNPPAPSLPPESLSRGFNPQARVYNYSLISRPFHHSYPSWFNPASSLSGSFGLGGYVGEFQYPGRLGVNNFNPELLGAYGYVSYPLTTHANEFCRFILFIAGQPQSSMPCSPSGGMEWLEAQGRGLSFETRTFAASSGTSSPPTDSSMMGPRLPSTVYSGKGPRPVNFGVGDMVGVYVLYRIIPVLCISPNASSAPFPAHRII
ncbi:hypothetical protein VP01_28g2 [Puccinia sorghi]|uniref:Uncharacterized protein n=1 Tax=Puccinia sorghi TaxID=27349 RepID=A0A0L6V1H0_9BASI|nr:hypothetical protein VP01_28g2 [Puccinia sorghi]